MSNTLELSCGYSKPTFKGTRQYRVATFEEVKSGLWHGLVSGTRGVVSVKKNGAVKIWKTRPNDLKLPIKYGMYEFGYVEFKDGELLYPSVTPLIEITA